MYDSTYSTKDDERILREKGLGNIANEHYKHDENLPSRTKFNKILRKPENKVRLQKFILKALKDKAIQSVKVIIYSTGLQCEDTATGDTGFNRIIVLDAADTNVYVTATTISNIYK